MKIDGTHEELLAALIAHFKPVVDYKYEDDTQHPLNISINWVHDNNTPEVRILWNAKQFDRFAAAATVIDETNEPGEYWHFVTTETYPDMTVVNLCYADKEEVKHLNDIRFTADTEEARDDVQRLDAKTDVSGE